MQVEFSFHNVHFIGIGGVGMSALAVILAESGLNVSGSDIADNSNFALMREKGIKINVGEQKAGNIPANADLVVFSSAVNPANPEYGEAERRGVRMVRRGHFLAEVASVYKKCVGISGSHGKTTTTAMLVHICRFAGLKPGFLIGGNAAGLTLSGSAGDGEVFISEIDESDGTQAAYSADIALILNIEDDHSWSAGGREKLFGSFRKVAESAENVFAYPDGFAKDILKGLEKVEWLDEDCIAPELTVPQAGLHNRKNAAIALEAALLLGIEGKITLEALACFPGVARRMTKIAEDTESGRVFIEDYAHHPTEVKAAIDALRESYSEKELFVIFQPHRFERVRHYSEGFSRELAKADKIIVCSPFAAWCDDSDIARPEEIVDRMNHANAEYFEVIDDNFLPLAEAVERRAAKKDVVVAIFGAGTINKLCPLLKEKLFPRF